MRYPCGIRLQDDGLPRLSGWLCLPSEPETNVNAAAQAGWRNQVPGARTGVVASRSCPVGETHVTQPSGRIGEASTCPRSVRAVTELTRPAHAVAASRTSARSTWSRWSPQPGAGDARWGKRQVDRNVVAAVNRLKAPSHARLIRNHEGILRVRLPIAPVGSGGVMDGAAGGVKDLLPVAGQQCAHQAAPSALRSIGHVTGSPPLNSSTSLISLSNAPRSGARPCLHPYRPTVGARPPPSFLYLSQDDLGGVSSKRSLPRIPTSGTQSPGGDALILASG